MMSSLEENLLNCQKQIKYQFKNIDLLTHALTHASYAATHEESYERLEFLGDSVFGLVIAEMLYVRFPLYTEGQLSTLKSSLVSRKTCARVARQLKLDQYLLTAGSFDVPPESIIADLLESIIGAVYLDAGFKRAFRLIEKIFAPEIELLANATTNENFKAALQDYAQQKMRGCAITYVLLDEKGPPHCRCFKMMARIGTKTFQAAWGATKKETEQRAAENALCQLQGQTPPHWAGD